VYRIEIDAVPEAVSGAADLGFEHEAAADQIEKSAAVRRTIRAGNPVDLAKYVRGEQV
jgi:hypothetical protein